MYKRRNPGREMDMAYVKDREARTGADQADATLHARVLDDADLLHFLKLARRRLACATALLAPVYASALATLELEAARRGIMLRGVRERVPAANAKRHLDRAIAYDDAAAVIRLLRWLDGRGLWRAYRYALEHPDGETSARLLERLHWHLNVRLFGVDIARTRRRRATRALRRLDAARRAERLRGALGYMFRKYYGLKEGKKGSA